MQLNDRIALRKLREEIDAALKPVATQLGLSKLRSGNIRYESDGLSAKITLNAETVSPDGRTKEESAFIRYADLFGLNKNDLHKTISYGRHGQFEIIGFMPAKRKFPILAVQKSTGSRKCLPISCLKLGGTANGN